MDERFYDTDDDIGPCLLSLKEIDDQGEDILKKKRGIIKKRYNKFEVSGKGSSFKATWKNEI